jgi:hypothetical protein
MTKDDLIKKLKDRFYYLNEQGLQRYYWDSVSGERLQPMHLFSHCQRWLKEAGEEPNKYSWLSFQHKLRNAVFTPIVLNPKYRPEESEVVEVDGNWHPNSWRWPEVKVPDSTTPAEKLWVKPFLEHLEMMLGSKKKVNYLLDLLAYRYQHPDHLKHPKPHIACYFYGLPGMGKGTLLKVLQNVFGETAVRTAADQKELTGGSSVDLWKRTWLVVEEVDVKQGSTDWNKIKGFTGTTSTDAAMKYQHVSKHELPAQLIMFSNSPPTFIEPNDRRFFISKFEYDFKDATEKEQHFKSYYQWLDSEHAYAAIAFLLKHRDVSKFSLAAEAMMTDEKRDICALVRDSVVEAISAKLEITEAICFIPTDFDEIWEANGIKPSQIKHKLSEAGLRKNASKRYANQLNTNQTRTLEIWTKPGWTLQRKQGQPATLLNTNNGKTMPLIDDAGYRGFWQQQRPEF